MGTLLNAIRARREAVAQERTKARAPLWGEYRVILQTQEHPQKGDEARLAELAEALGIDERHAELHLIVLQRLAELEGVLSRANAAAAKLPEVVAQREALGNQINALRAKFVDLQPEYDGLRRDRSCGSSAPQQIARLRQLFPGLFGDEAKPAPLDRDEEGGWLGEALRHLGLQDEFFTTSGGTVSIPEARSVEGNVGEVAESQELRVDRGYG